VIESRAPRLTIGIPLHRSRPFIDVVSANIDAVDRRDVEILLSDRTGLDDALEELAARHRTNGRVIPLWAVDGSNWVEHCNALLRQARGTYFCWMPHDDDFPRGWVDTLLGYLEGEPDLLMAFGHMERVVIGETRPDILRNPHPPIGTGCDTWTVDDAIAVLGRWRGGYAFRGMFRRDVVVAHGLFLPRTRDTVDADLAWVFGMALLGRLRYVPEVACRKRYYAGSEHRTWTRDAAHHCSLAWMLSRYTIRFSGSPGDALRALAAIGEYTVTRLGWGTSRRARIMRGLGRLGSRVLRPRTRRGGTGSHSALEE
jgi:hypothetical protein